MSVWHVTRPDRWLREQEIGRHRLSDFSAGIEPSGIAFIKGKLKVISEGGFTYGPFSLRIAYPSNFPDHGAVPSVFLESHRWRWKNLADSHIESDWKLCLFVPGNSEIDFTFLDSLNRLIDVTSVFLVKESLYQEDLERSTETGRRAEWIGPEYEHGIKGLRQALVESGKKLGRNDPCICGSGKKAKHCHFDLLWRRL